MGRSNGYECRECGYSPTDDELQHGLCPRCNDIGPARKVKTSPESEAHGRLVSRLHGIAWRLDAINQDPKLSDENAALVQAAAKLVDDALAEAGAR